MASTHQLTLATCELFASRASRRSIVPCIYVLEYRSLLLLVGLGQDQELRVRCYVDTKTKGSGSPYSEAKKLKDMFIVEYTKATAKHLKARQAR
mmetsp:Transcript_26625/g.54101  ORF Transcript_26625/g.54101 Transcript_26625/m.54101 type:complete len:94 (-) Transcript_26625:79-360(-)